MATLPAAPSATRRILGDLWDTTATTLGAVAAYGAGFTRSALASYGPAFYAAGLACIAAALMVFYVTEMKADSAVITVNYLGVEYTVSVERRNIEVPNGQNFKNN